MRRLASAAAAAVAGAVVGGITVLAADSLTRTIEPAPPAAPPEVVPAPRLPSPRVLLVWAPAPGLDAGAEDAATRVPGVASATTVRAGLDWILSSRSADGAVVDDPERGLAVPFETAVVDPARYAGFVAPGDRQALLSLRPGQVVLARTAAALRGAARGTRVRLRDRTVTVAAIVADETTQGYEAMAPGPVPARWRRVYPFLLVRLTAGADAATVERRLRTAVGRHPLRIRSYGENPFLRYGDAVLPLLKVKQTFGEFAARPLPGGRLAVDPAWRAANIRTRRVPLLGRITCHRAVFDQLAGAMTDLADRGLAHTVSSTAGCYDARFINRDPDGRISHHSWGIAIDVNAAANPFGAAPAQDPRLVETMESWGFTWGGRWLIPDGMHFEWARPR